MMPKEHKNPKTTKRIVNRYDDEVIMTLTGYRAHAKMAKSSSDVECDSSSTIDPTSGFCNETKIYHSLRPKSSPNTVHVSVADYAFSLLRESLSRRNASAGAGIIDASTGRRISYSDFMLRSESLACFLQRRIGLSKGDVAFVLSPNSIHVPILYLALFSIGVVISPSNPISTELEISRQIGLSGPVIAFATSATAHKIPSLRYKTIVLDSAEFESAATTTPHRRNHEHLLRVKASRHDPATILYSSGTTGKVKGVVLTHGNWTWFLAGALAVRPDRPFPAVSFCAVPLFHVYGFLYSVKAVAFGETLVLMERFDVRAMMRGIEEHKVTHAALAPPVIVQLVKDREVMNGYDLRSLEVVASGGAPLAKLTIEKFVERLPNIQLAQAYGLTETTGGVTRTIGPIESKVFGASGKLISDSQAKIVDPETSAGLPPMNAGELWVRGPLTMKGYVGDEEATREVLDSDGWFRTGDLCYFDNEGYLFYVERIKELIKYKGYQVAPAELEHLLLSHPDIVDAAVIPYPDEEAGQVPVAFIVRRPESTISESEIKDYVAKQVSPYKKIRRVSFIKFIPKNASGKVLRKELVALALSGATSKL